MPELSRRRWSQKVWPVLVCTETVLELLPLHVRMEPEVPAGREDEMSVSISAVGAVAYVCCTVTFVLLVCLLFFLGLTPTQR